MVFRDTRQSIKLGIHPLLLLWEFLLFYAGFCGFQDPLPTANLITFHGSLEMRKSVL
jgi:hypothetical protein